MEQPTAALKGAKSMGNPWERFENFKESHCWQYEVRKRNLTNDLRKANMSVQEMESLRVGDFSFSYIDKSEKEYCKRIKMFIKENEWLGKMPNRPTHRFVATYKGHIAGVIIMATPNAFSHLLGKENKDLEKLIARGACISWSPKNLASSLINFSIRWMVENTRFRYFTAYSDSEAKELGTVYQASNFIYLGKKSGAKKMYFDENRPSKGWFSSREFRKVSSYKRYAAELGILWEFGWSTKDKMNWENLPKEIERKLRNESKSHSKRCLVRNVSPKGKYVKILGRNKRETRQLLSLFLENNPKLNKRNKGGVLIGNEYPKDR